MVRYTPIWSLPHEEITDIPGISLTGDGATVPALADAIEDALESISTIVATTYQVGGVLVLDSSGDFEKSSIEGLRGLWVQMTGAGGAGGGAGGFAVGGGGGGGGYVEFLVDADDIPASAAFTIGAGGAPVAGDNGGAGTNTVFLGRIAGGGQGGRMNTVSGSGVVAADGGTGGAVVAPGDLATTGIGGSAGWSTANEPLGPSIFLEGQGAASLLGSSPAQLATPGSPVGTDAIGWGSGGNGVSNRATGPARSGGAGSDGVIIARILL